MNAKANPTRRAELLDEGSVLRHRSLFCSEYDDCLDEAAEARWASWTCEKCPFAKVRDMQGARVDLTSDAPERHELTCR